MDKIKKYLQKNKKLLSGYLCIACIIGVAMIVMYQTEIKSAMPQPRSIMTVKDGLEAPGNFINLSEKIKIQQKIPMVSTSFTGFSLWFEEDMAGGESEISVQLRDDAEQLVEKWVFNSGDIIGGGFFNFYLPRVEPEVGDIYIITVEADSESELSVPVGVVPMEGSIAKNEWLSEMEVNRATGLERTDNGYTLAYRILDGGCESLKYFYLAVAIIIFFLISLTYFLISTSQKKEWIFVAMAFLMGSIYMLIIPPYAVPDEGAHFTTAYAQSSMVMGRTVGDADGNVVLEPEGASYFVRNEYPDKSSYATLIRGIFGKEPEVVQEEITGRGALNMKNLGYVPQVLGLIIGRLFHVNAVWLFLLGRTAALLWYGVVMFFAMRIIPEFGKNILFVAGLMPMTMQQVVSYNYDSVLLGTSFFVISYFLYVAYNEKKEKIVLKDYILMGIFIVVIVPIKLIYMPLLGLGLLIPKEKFGGIKIKTIAGTVIVVSSVLILSVQRWGVIAKSVSTGAGISTYTLMECLQKPVNTFLIFVKTIERYISMYYQSMIGSPLGWFEIGIPNIILYGFTVMMFCSLLTVQGEYCWKKWEKVWLLVISGGIALLVLLAMLQEWTPKGSALIEGVQGRYFIPILPLLLFALQNRTIVLKKRIDTLLISGILILQVCTVMSVVTVIVSR